METLIPIAIAVALVALVFYSVRLQRRATRTQAIARQEEMFELEKAGLELQKRVLAESLELQKRALAVEKQILSDFRLLNGKR